MASWGEIPHDVAKRVIRFYKQNQTTMTKKDFINSISEKSGLKKEATERAVDGMMQTMFEAFESGNSITLRGLGTFEVKTMTGRKGRDIKNGVTIDLPDTRKVRFVPCAELKEAMKL